MNKKYLIGIYKISKQNNYIVAHALYSYARKPVDSESIYFHFLTERWCTH